MKKILLGLAFAALLACGCQKINDLESRMNTAETNIQSLQSDLAKLQAAVDAKYAVNSFKETADGFVLTLTDGTTINLRNGKDGKNGADGAPGAPGAPGADGADGDAFFQSVESVDGNLVITLVDGKVFTLPLVDVLASVTSFVFVPEYSDGLATRYTVDGSDFATINLSAIVSPASVANAIAADKTMKYAVLVAGTQTRAAEVQELTNIIPLFDGNVLSVTAECTGVDPNAKFAIQISNATSTIITEFVGATSVLQFVLVGDDIYPVKEMKDGKVWMAWNLHYVPEGMEVSADFSKNTGIWYPAALNWDGSKATATASTDASVISRQGLLYTEEVALGGPLPAEDFVDAENIQGICPDGWHIPTAEDWLGLVGGCSNKEYINADAPYYNATLAGASLEALNADGLNLKPYPYVNQGKSYQAAVLNKNEESPYSFMNSMAYFACSTGRSEKQSYAAMINNNATKCVVTLAFNNLTNGVSVRCVKD